MSRVAEASACRVGAVLRLGDVIEVAILRIEADRGRIALAWPGADTAG
jgi:ribosomal protein S1